MALLGKKKKDTATAKVSKAAALPRQGCRWPADRNQGSAEGAFRPSHAEGYAAIGQPLRTLRRDASRHRACQDDLERAEAGRIGQEARSQEDCSQEMNADVNTSAEPAAEAAPAAPRAKNTRTLIGKVVSGQALEKPMTVLVERRVKHELYGKIVAKTSKYHAHDEKGEYRIDRRCRSRSPKAGRFRRPRTWVVTRLVAEGLSRSDPQRQRPLLKTAHNVGRFVFCGAREP